MARFARLVVPGVGHHITQRGNHQQDVFFSDADRRMYVEILHDHAERRGVRILAWCLMTNHVHLIAVPPEDHAMALALGRTHNEYARWLHVRQRRVGHLWQNRFYSCPLQGKHLWAAARYVELNPVRAGLAQEAGDWRWSSAGVHLGGHDEWNLVDCEWWSEVWTPRSWEETLALAPHEHEFGGSLRASTRSGRPCGDTEWIETLEVETGRSLRPQRPGPKRAGEPRSCGIA